MFLRFAWCARSSIMIFKQNIFKSAYNVESLYPTSNPIAAFTNAKVPDISDPNGIIFNGYIPTDQIQFSFMRSSGPGGQHVNKTNSKVEIKFLLETATWIPAKIKEKFVEKHRNYVTSSGYVIIKSERTRVQHLNVADCIDKLRSSLYDVSEELQAGSALPDPEKVAKIRLCQEMASRRRLNDKRRKSALVKERKSEENWG